MQKNEQIKSRTSIHKNNYDYKNDIGWGSSEDLSKDFSEDNMEDITDDEDNSKNSTEQSDRTNDCSDTNQNVLDKTNRFRLALVCIVAALAIGGALSKFTNIEKNNQITIRDLHRNYPTQPEYTWRVIEAVINDVLKIEPIHPAVFLFTYEQDDSTDMIHMIAKFASDKLGVSHDHIVMDESDYTHPKADDYGYLIEKHRSDLDKRKVMVVKNLHKMPGKVAQYLHSFCDEYNPLVDRAVYILTLKVDSYVKSELHTAEKVLNELWGDLKGDIRVALITRVTSTVIKIL